MTRIGSVYAHALYSLAKEEGQSLPIMKQLKNLHISFSQEPNFLRLLASPNLPKQERCGILDDCFRGKVYPYVLNFLKLLTEKGYMGHFGACCQAYQALYHADNGILVVRTVTAVPLSSAQSSALKGKLARITGKTIELENRVDPACLGGVRLDYDGMRVDGTVAHRLEAVAKLLKHTVL